MPDHFVSSHFINNATITSRPKTPIMAAVVSGPPRLRTLLLMLDLLDGPSWSITAVSQAHALPAEAKLLVSRFHRKPSTQEKLDEIALLTGLEKKQIWFRRNGRFGETRTTSKVLYMRFLTYCETTTEVNSLDQIPDGLIDAFAARMSTLTITL